VSPWTRIGWRNLGRNRRRTILTAGGLAVGYCGVVLLAGLAEGIVNEMLRNGTGVLTGQIQIHHPAYLPDRDVFRTLGGRQGTDVSAVLAAAETDPDVAAAAPRVQAGGLVSTGAATSGVILIGIDPAREARTTLLLGALSEGRPPVLGANEALIGRELSRLLGADVGDTLVVVAPAADGSMGNDLFTVSGIFTSGIGELDVGTVMVPLDALQALLALPVERIHEVAVRVPDPWRAPAAAARLATALASDSIAVRDWTRLRPELTEYAGLIESSYWIVLIVVFAMAIFGVANTLLMATFERRYEIALLRTLGAGPGGLTRSILVEAIALGAVSTAVGAVAAVALIAWWHHSPLDLSRLFGGFSMMGSFIRPVLRTEYPVAMFFEAALALMVTAVLASLYPAWRAIRIPPAETLAGR
jgi:ABC-type lipoprotein release transport system permease subunit